MTRQRCFKVRNMWIQNSEQFGFIHILIRPEGKVSRRLSSQQMNRQGLTYVYKHLSHYNFSLKCMYIVYYWTRLAFSRTHRKSSSGLVGCLNKENIVPSSFLKESGITSHLLGSDQGMEVGLEKNRVKKKENWMKALHSKDVVT